MKVVRRSVFLSLTVLTLGSGLKTASGQGNEYDVKAMFIYNFIKYVNWQGMNNAEAFRIGVLGKSDIILALEAISGQKKFDNRRIMVSQITPEDNFIYQIIFVPKAQSQKVEELSRKYIGKGVLIVSEECKQGEHNATINLVTKENKVRFELNQASANVAGLKIANALTNLAIVIKP